jgi:hypothetical protein
MTNSNLEKRKEVIISEDRTTQETVRYVSNRDKQFKVKRQSNGLYKIEMVGGGIAPKICEGLYTGHKEAEQKLILYLIEGDRLGYAQYPGKENNVKSQNE